MCAASVWKWNTKIDYQPQGRWGKLATIKDTNQTFRALALRQSESENSCGRCYLYREGGATWLVETNNRIICLNLRNEKRSLIPQGPMVPIWKINFCSMLLRPSVLHCKPTDSNSYLLHSTIPPSTCQELHPLLAFLRLRHLCSDDTDFSAKAEEMWQFFKTRGYPDPVIHNSKHRAQSIHPQFSYNKQEERIPLTLTFHHTTSQSKTSS